MSDHMEEDGLAVSPTNLAEDHKKRLKSTDLHFERARKLYNEGRFEDCAKILAFWRNIKYEYARVHNLELPGALQSPHFYFGVDGDDGLSDSLVPKKPYPEDQGTYNQTSNPSKAQE